LKNSNTFKANEEVDVLDEKECYIRAKVNDVKGTVAEISYRGETRSYSLDKVFKCGEKLPFINCENPSTNPIKIKFTPQSTINILQKKNIGNFLYDSGNLAKQYDIFYYGWTKNAQTHQINNLDNEKEKNKIIEGTSAEISPDTEWFIKVPNMK